MRRTTLWPVVAIALAIAAQTLGSQALEADKILLPVNLDQMSRLIQLANAKTGNLPYAHHCESSDGEISCGDKVGNIVITYSAATDESGVTRVNFAARAAYFSVASDFAAGIAAAAEDDQSANAVPLLTKKISKAFDVAYLTGMSLISLKKTDVLGMRIEQNEDVMLRLSPK